MTLPATVADRAALAELAIRTSAWICYVRRRRKRLPAGPLSADEIYAQVEARIDRDGAE